MLFRSAFVLAVLVMAHPFLGTGPAASNVRLLIFSTPTFDEPACRAQTALCIAECEGLIGRDFSVRTVTGSKALPVGNWILRGLGVIPGEAAAHAAQKRRVAFGTKCTV